MTQRHKRGVWCRMSDLTGNARSLADQARADLAVRTAGTALGEDRAPLLEVPADALFDMQPAAPIIAPTAKLSADRRRTIRQRNDLARGVHPLSKPIGRPEWRPLLVHDDENRTCGNCRFRVQTGHYSRSYPKCSFDDYVRATHGAATDVRAWWRACTDHEAASA